jgi:ATP-dependent DNA helicase RecG
VPFTKILQNPAIISCRILQDFAGLNKKRKTPMEIENLLFQPESKVLEFKRDLSSLEPIIKTIIAFANTAGGILIIGKSQDGKIVGVKDIFKAEEALANSISDNIQPAILPEMEITSYKKKNLLLVKVTHWKAPFYLKRQGPTNGVYIRLGSTNRVAGPEILAELQRSAINISYDQQSISGATKDDLDFGLISKTFGQIKKEFNEEKLCSLGILVPSGNKLLPSMGGLILFGKKTTRDRIIPFAKVRCARFAGTDKTEILDRYEMEGTILDAAEEIPKFIARNTRLTGEIKEIRRKDIREYPSIAIREALINALVHADYSLGGSDIQVAIFNDRLEIQNPGMFPFGFTIDDFKAGISRIRNRVIARIFYELRLMEQWGSGYKRIIENCKTNNYPKPKFEELGTTIRVTFFPHSKTTLPSKKIKKTSTDLTAREEIILSLFKGKATLAFHQIHKKTTPQISERTLRYDLMRLKEKGLLISKGKGRALVWKRV